MKFLFTLNALRESCGILLCLCAVLDLARNFEGTAVQISGTPFFVALSSVYSALQIPDTLESVSSAWQNFNSLLGFHFPT